MRFTPQLVAAPFALFLSAAALAQQTEVSVMPGYPNAPHMSPEQRFPGREGAPIVLWGNANRGAGIDPTATYEWYLAPNGNVTVTTDGDLTGTIADSTFIPEEVSFQLLNGSTSEIVAATLIVTDGANGASQSTVELQIVTVDDPITDDPVKALRFDARIAVQQGLRWLYTKQHANGRWQNLNYPSATTAFVLWSMQNQGHSILHDPVEDIMTLPLERGFDYIFREFATIQTDLADRSTPRATVSLGATAPGISDLNQNGQIVEISPSTQSGYKHPIALAAIIASLAPDHVVREGDLTGMTFRTVVEDGIDWLGARQNAGADPNWAGTSFLFDGRGGWNYTPAHSATRSDMSINSWPYIAMEGAIEAFGIDVPDWIKKQVEYTLVGHMDGQVGDVPFGYTGPGQVGGTTWTATSAAGLSGIVLAQTGTNPGDVIAQYTAYGLDTLGQQRANALGHIGAAWDNPGGNTFGNGNRGNYYVMWTTARSMRATARALGMPEEENVPLVFQGQTFDWETGAAPGSTVVPTGPTEGYWNYLVRTQDLSANVTRRGRWSTGHQLRDVGSTALAIMVLTRNVFRDPCPSLVSIPVESLSPTSGDSFEAGVPFTFSGRAVRAGVTRPIVEVQVDGRPVTSLDATGQFFTSLMLQPGSNIIRIEAFDSCGSEVTVIELFGTTFGGGIGEYGDVTPFLELDYMGTTFNQANGWLIVDAAVRNLFDQPLSGPLLLVIDSFNTTAVNAVNTDGVLPDGRPYFAFQAGISDPPIAPGATSAPRQLIFSNPSLEPFQYQTTWLAPGNAPPAFQSAPRVRTAAQELYRYAAVALDPEGADVSFALLVGPLGMTVDGVTGEMLWTPTLLDIGMHQIVLEASDGTAGTTRQTWALEVAEYVGSEPPFFTSAPVTQVAVGAEYRYQVESGDPTNDPRTVSVVAGPAGVTVDAAGLVEWGFTFPGDYPIHLRVTDASGAHADQGYVLTVGSTSTNPHSPTIDGNPSVLAAADVPYIYQPITNDLDPLDVLTVSLDQAPTGMTVHPLTGRVDWLPGVSQIGTHDVVVRVEDGAGGFGTQAWTIDARSSLANGVPVVTSLPLRIALANAPYTYDVEATDPDNDPLRFELVAPPAGMTIDAGTGVIDWTPAGGAIVTVAIQVFDSALSTGPYGSQVFSLDVAASNQPPSIVSVPAIENPLGRTYYYDTNAVDPEQQTLTYGLVNAPASATIDALTGVVRWPATEFDPNPGLFEVSVSDIHGALDTQSFSVALVPDTEPPSVLITSNPPAAPMGEPVDICVVAADNVGVTERTLSIDGASVTLDPQGCIRRTFPAPGTAQLVATARDEAGNMTIEMMTLVIVDPNATNAPTIDIISPLPGALVLGPVDIVGTIDDDAPASIVWRVDVRRAGALDWREIGQGVGSVQGGTLARFDPTLLPNDRYDVRVVADDGVNLPQTAQFPYDVAGDFKLGDYGVSLLDLTVPLAGFPLSVQRSYSTLDDSVGDFGPGWKLQIAGALHDTAPEEGTTNEVAYRGNTRVYVTLPTGQLEVFRFQATAIPLFFGATVSFVPEGTASGRLEVARFEDTICYQSGGLFFTPFAPYNPSLFRYTDELGNQYLFDEALGLQMITDNQGETIDVLPSGIYSSRGPVVLFERDAFGRIERVVGPDVDPNDPLPARTVEYLYDPVTGVLIGSVDPTGAMTEYVYGDPAFPHHMTEIRDPLGRSVVRNKFDADGRMIAQCGPDGDITTCQGCVAFEIDSSQDMQVILTAAGDRIELYYSERGDLLVERRWIDASTIFEITRTYDDDGRLLSETLPNNATTTWTYDGLGRLRSLTTAEGHLWTRTYGPCGITSVIAPDGDTTVIQYDEDCRPTGVTDPLGATEHYGYETTGRIKSITNPGGGAVCLTYDGPVGSLNGFIDQEGQVETIAVNEDGMARFRIDRTGRQTSYGYDEAGRVVREDWDSGNSIVSEYDAAGRRVSIEDDVSRLEFEYWPSGTLKQTSTTWLSNGMVERLVYGEGDINAPTPGYDLRGNLTSILDSHGGQTLFTYDLLGRLNLIRWPASGSDRAPIVGGTRDRGAALVVGAPPAAGPGQTGVPPETTVRQVWNDAVLGDSWIQRRIERIPGDPGMTPTVTTHYTHDVEGDPTTLAGIEHVLVSTGVPIQSFTFARGVDGFFRSWTDAEGTHSVQLDGLERIQSVDHPAGPQPDESYTYDANGNRIASSLDTGYVHANDSGQGSDRLLQTDTFDFTYDELGSLLRMEELATGEVFDFTYDHRRRVRSIIRSNGGTVQRTVEFDYDPFDRLIEQRVDGAIKRFVYEGVNPILTLDGAGNVLERRMYTREFDELRAVWRPDEVLWPLRDQVDSVRDWVSADGLTVEHVVYDTFGQRLAGNVAGLPSVGFQSRDQIADLPFYDFRMRVYDPRLGRFLQEDQTRPWGYAFAANNPHYYGDPTGYSELLQYACLSGNGIGNGLTIGNVVGGVVRPIFEGVTLGLQGGTAEAARALGREGLQNFLFGITIDFVVLVLPLDLPCAANIIDVVGDVGSTLGYGEGGLKSHALGNPAKGFFRPHLESGPGPFGAF